MMKKIQKRLKIGAETIRSLGAQQLGRIAAGYPTQTERAGACTVTTYSDPYERCCTCECSG
jgi:hypothetical protein